MSDNLCFMMSEPNGIRYLEMTHVQTSSSSQTCQNYSIHLLYGLCVIWSFNSTSTSTYNTCFWYCHVLIQVSGCKKMQCRIEGHLKNQMNSPLLHFIFFIILYPLSSILLHCCQVCSAWCHSILCALNDQLIVQLTIFITFTIRIEYIAYNVILRWLSTNTHRYISYAESLNPKQ